jgi:hypothetical protein
MSVLVGEFALYTLCSVKINYLVTLIKREVSVLLAPGTNNMYFFDMLRLFVSKASVC